MTDMYRVRTRLSLVGGGTSGLATHWFKASGGTAQQAVTAVGSFWFACLANASNSCFTFTGEDGVATVNSLNGKMVGLTAVAPVNSGGGGAGDALPGANQGLLRLFTNAFSNGHQIRGHLNIPGQIEATSNGQPSGASQLNWTTAAAALIADANSIWGVYSRKNLDIFDIVATQGSNYYGILRSRRN